eukprot:ctg_4021.g619
MPGTDRHRAGRGRRRPGRHRRPHSLSSFTTDNRHRRRETENTASSASTSNGMLVPEAPSDGGHAHWLQRLLQAPTDDPAEEQHDGTG